MIMRPFFSQIYSFSFVTCRYFNNPQPGHFAFYLRRTSGLQVPGHHRLPIQQLVPRRSLEGPVPQARGSRCRCDLGAVSANQSAGWFYSFSLRGVGSRQVALVCVCSPGEPGRGVQSHSVHGGSQRRPPASHRRGHADLQAEEVGHALHPGV